jgi:quercetin 2,3-dioxygenase
MTNRIISKLVPATPTPEGKGVTVYRTIASPGFSHLDPFLLLDEFVISPHAKDAGFPDHPHRGFETVTYMLSGQMRHADNAGNAGVIGPGAVQWMTAGRGVVHSEMPESDGDKGDDIRGMQIWVNLAAREKMKAPYYQDIDSAEIPTVKLSEHSWVRVIAGEFDGHKSPVSGIAIRPLYLDINLAAGESIQVPVVADHQAFIYVIEGALENGAAQTSVPMRNLAILDDGDQIKLRGGDNGGRAILLSAAKIDEPIARYGPFVMNTREEISIAIDDYNAGRF